MSGALGTSIALLWIVVLALAVAVAALARQIGILHTRLAPAGALMTSAGPRVGESAPELDLEALSGERLQVGVPDARGLLLLFVSPTCPVCKALVPVAKSLQRSERKRLRLAFASDGGTPQQHRRYVADLGIEAYPYLLSMDLGMAFEVAKLPYAVLIGPDGVLRSKGLVNSREHLESLLEAMDSGFTSIQDYLHRDAPVDDDTNPPGETATPPLTEEVR